MDRLSTIILLIAISTVQCKTDNASSPPPSRTVSVQAKPSAEDPLIEFCDFLDREGNKKVLKRPETTGLAPSSDSGYRWINIWATWCKPCIEEIPFIVEWVDRLNKSGANIQVEFISVDEEPEVLQRFYQARPTFPTSSRLVDPEALAPWIAEIGLDSGAGLPIHIFADTKSMIRCARAAAVKQSDYSAVEKLVQ